MIPEIALLLENLSPEELSPCGIAGRRIREAVHQYVMGEASEGTYGTPPNPSLVPPKVAVSITIRNDGEPDRKRDVKILTNGFAHSMPEQCERAFHRATESIILPVSIEEGHLLLTPDLAARIVSLARPNPPST